MLKTEFKNREKKNREFLEVPLSMLSLLKSELQTIRQQNACINNSLLLLSYFSNSYAYYYLSIFQFSTSLSIVAR